MPAGDGYGGRRAQRWVAAVLAEHGDLCHLCHHPGAESADHIVTRAELVERGELYRLYELGNGRPVHHKRCPVCSVACNTRRKSQPLTTAPPVDDVRFFDSGAPTGTASRPPFLDPENNSDREEPAS